MRYANHIELQRDTAQMAREARGLEAKARKLEAKARKLEVENERLRALLIEAPHYFHPGYDFDGKKLEWLKRAGLVA